VYQTIFSDVICLDLGLKVRGHSKSMTCFRGDHLQGETVSGTMRGRPLHT